MVKCLRASFKDIAICWALVLTGYTIAFLLCPTKVQATDCQRVQATCNYYIVGEQCISNRCPDSAWCSRIPRCCYVEWGFCEDDSRYMSVSAICGGLCSNQLP